MEFKIKGIGCKHEKLLTGSYFHMFSRCVFIKFVRFVFLVCFTHILLQLCLGVFVNVMIEKKVTIISLLNFCHLFV